MMRNFIDSLKINLATGNWYSALFIALTLPDICGKIDHPGDSSGFRYKKWFEEYIQLKYNREEITRKVFVEHNAELKKYRLQRGDSEELIDREIKKMIKSREETIRPSQEQPIILSGSDCYALRCALLHEGSEDIFGQRAQERIESFMFTAPTANTHHCGLIDGKILQLQVDIFCQDILEGVEEWMAKNNQNIPSMLKITYLNRSNSGNSE